MLNETFGPNISMALGQFMRYFGRNFSTIDNETGVEFRLQDGVFSLGFPQQPLFFIDVFPSVPVVTQFVSRFFNDTIDASVDFNGTNITYVGQGITINSSLTLTFD
jgi:hypothetical protein